MIDSHCHLELQTYGAELPDVLARARAKGVSPMIAVGASGGILGAEEVVTLAAKEPDVFAAVGIHPHDAALASETAYERLFVLARAPKVVAIGEIGLDYHYDNSPRVVQQQVFAELLRRAKPGALPIMLHVRDAHPDTFSLLDAIGLPEAYGVVHCFTGGPDEARAYVARGLSLSISGIVTFKNAEALRQAVVETPIDRILVETDSPYLSPVPVRGKRNEPSFLPWTLSAVAKLKGVSEEEMGRVSSANAMRVFALPALMRPPG